MKLLDLLSRNLGEVVQAQGGLGGECVDLINLYLPEVLGLPEVHANAMDFAGKAIPGLSWVKNGATNYPAMGDIVVWGQSAAAGTGPNGHIAIALAADSMHLLTCDQNWLEGAPVAVILHGYVGVNGWFTRAK